MAEGRVYVIWENNLFHDDTYLGGKSMQFFVVRETAKKTARRGGGSLTDLEIVGQPVSEADRTFLTVQKVLGG